MSSQLLPPAQPAFVLRGHSTPIHALHFTTRNARLLTGDADGWVVSWNLASKRPVASWKAHESTILGLGSWGIDRVITHGRDNRLNVWHLGPAEEDELDKTLPIDARTSPKSPWMLHSLTVNTLNFCSFAMCVDGMVQSYHSHSAVQCSKGLDPVLVAVPNTVDSNGIDIFQLPSETRAAVILADRNLTTGMVMALDILAETSLIQVAAGYESGHTMVYAQNDPGAAFQRLYCSHPHSQPVLSLSISPSHDHYFTSSADAILAKHPLPAGKSIWKTDLKPFKISQTKHSGQQGCRVRSDSRVFATAGWDSRIRVYSAKTMKELAVLKWHKGGCYATAFAAILDHDTADHPDGESVSEEGSSDSSTNNLAVARPKKSSAVSTVQQRRDEKARATHWLAAGSKDGKVSLWDIY